MKLPDLLFVMANVNRAGTLENIAEAWFPDDGPPDFVFGMNSAFYFDAHGDVSRKAAMVGLAADYFEATDTKPNILVQESRTARIASASDIQRVLTTSADGDPTVGDLKDEYRDPRRPLSFFIKHIEGDRANRPTSSYFSCLVDGGGSSSAGLLQRHDNYERVAPDHKSFIESFVASCEKLKCFYAVSGFSLLTTSFNSYKSVRNYPIFRRFPGLLYWNNWTAAPDGDRSDNWILDVNWLTAIDDEMLQRIGGYDKVRDAMDSEIVIHRFAGGVVFQAGPKPQIGDADASDIPAAYREVSRILRPLRYRSWRSLDHVMAPPPMDDREATSDWIARFD